MNLRITDYCGPTRGWLNASCESCASKVTRLLHLCSGVQRQDSIDLFRCRVVPNAAVEGKRLTEQGQIVHRSWNSHV